MALTFSNTTITSTGGISTTAFDTGLTTKNANTLQLLAIETPGQNITSISDTGLVWSSATTIQNNGWGQLTALYYTLSASTVTSRTTVNLSGNNNAIGILDQAAGCDLSGTSGSGAVVQVKQGTGLPLSLATFGSVNNVAYGLLGSDSTLTFRVGNASWTTIGAFALVGNAIVLTTETSSNTTALRGNSFGGHVGAIGAEIKAGAGGTAYTSQVTEGVLLADQPFIASIVGGDSGADAALLGDKWAFSYQQGGNADPGDAGWHKWHRTRGGHSRGPRRPF